MLRIVLFISLLIIVYMVLKYYIKNKILTYGIDKENKIIKFGQSCVLSGGTKDIGISYQLGILLGFQEHNKSNPLYKVNLYSLDDRYEPELALENVKLLLEYYDSFAIIGSVGTPTSIAIYNYLSNKEDQPFIAPLTGSNFFRIPFKKNIINIRPSYYQEIETIFNKASELKISNFSVFYQNDTFGNSVLQDIQKYIITNQKINTLNQISTGNYERNTVNLENAISNILEIDKAFDKNIINTSKILQRLEFIILISTYVQAYEIIKYFKQIKPNLVFFCISFVDSITLIDMLKNDINNVYICNIFDCNNNSMIDKKLNNLIKEYNKTQKTEFKISPIVKEGYILSRLISNIINSLGDDIDRKKFLDKIYKTKNIQIDDLILGPYLDNKECINTTEECPSNDGLKKSYIC